MSDDSIPPNPHPVKPPPNLPKPRTESLEAENARLKAEVERLRKAGDVLERVLTARSGSYEAGNASHEWNAAKKGKVELTDCKADADRFKAEVERLKNNDEYIDKKLDEYIDGDCE